MTAFAEEVDRLSCMIDIASRAERLRLAMRAVRQKVRADGTLETDKDLLDWLKFAQSETTGIKLGLSTMDPTEIDASIDAAWQEPIKEEVNRRLTERGLTLDVEQSNASQRQISTGRKLTAVPPQMPPSKETADRTIQLPSAATQRNSN